MSNHGAWLAAAMTGVLMIVALAWALSQRYAPRHRLVRAADRARRSAGPLWMLIGATAFLLPVLIYWVSARSHPNALAGFLPWNDAAGYHECSQSYLFGFRVSDACSRRPFYTAFFAVLLWLTGNQLQLALLLQALLTGCGAVLLLRELARDRDGSGALAAYAVLFLFAAELCASLIMTENAGLLLGLLAMAVLWRQASAPRPYAVLLAGALMAGAQNARAGAMLVLPALIGWVMLHGAGRWPRRLGLALAVGVGIGAGIAVTSASSLIVNGKLGSPQANFSYSLYGLVAGGKGWLHVFKTRPDIFADGGSEAVIASRIYGAAVDSVLQRPHLFVFGYIKGLAHYFAELFDFVPLKPLRYGLLVPLWLLGLWIAVRHWREAHSALLLWLQGGVLLSSPFITFDGGNRIYAATMGVDAALVGLGVTWLSGHMAARFGSGPSRLSAAGQGHGLMAAALCALLLPGALLVAIRAGAAPVIYPAPNCGPLEPVVVRPGRSTLALPLVAPGEAGLYPLRVRADHFAARMDKSVHNANELRQPAGTTLVWGYRLDAAAPGAAIRFRWNGSRLPVGDVVGFCVQPPAPGSKRSLGQADRIYRDLSGVAAD